MKKIIIIDTSYNLKKINKLKLNQVIESRNLDNYFAKVFSVHPLSTIEEPNSYKRKFGKYNLIKISNDHLFIEGKIGFSKYLNFLSIFNFFISQLHLFIFLSNLIKKENIGYIKGGSPNYSGFFSYLLSKYNSIPYVIRVGSNNDKIYEVTSRPVEKKFFKLRFIEKYFENIVLKNASFVIAANKNNLNFALQNSAKIRLSKVIRYSHLIDPIHFIDPDKREINEDLFNLYNINKNNYIIYVGRLEKVKHPIDTILVLKELINENKDLKLVIFGDGSEKKNLIEFYKINNIQNNIIFAGNVSQEILANIIPFAALAISPHTGRALVEVGLSRIPVVAYDIDWQSELINSGITGELVPYRDIIKLITSSKKILKNLKYSKSIANNLRDRCIKLFDPKKAIKEEVDIYEKI